MVKLTDEQFYFIHVCRCVNWTKTKGRVKYGHPEICTICNKWAKHQLQTCRNCIKLSMSCYSHPDRNPYICWNCINRSEVVARFNRGYGHFECQPLIPPHFSVINEPLNLSAFLAELPEIPDALSFGELT